MLKERGAARAENETVKTARCVGLLKDCDDHRDCDGTAKTAKA